MVCARRPDLEEDIDELYESAPCGYISTLPDGTIVKVNRTFLGWTGYPRDELLSGKRFQEMLTAGGRIYHETHYAPLLRMQGFVNEVALDLVRKDGRRMPVLVSTVQKRDATGTPLLNRTTVFDATDRRKYERELLEAKRKAETAAQELNRLNATLEERIAREVEERMRAEEEMRQAHKLEAVGQLTGGVAHDFNNLLQALAGCLRLIERKVPDPQIRPLLDAGRQAVDRGAALTRQLLAFSRRQPLRSQSLDVPNSLMSMSVLLAHALRADIRLEIDLEPGLWPIEVDPTQFETALLNLAVNARDAMPQGGRLTIRGRNVTLGAPQDPAGGLTGECVAIAVEDEGTGMPPEIRERVFEPFFTTKEVGKGTGLGLSQVYGFVRQSSGSVRIDSQSGQGTTVTILLPRAKGEPIAAPAAVRWSTIRKGQILLVEDDPIVGAVTAATLEDLGHRVIRTATADEAFAAFEAGLDFDLLCSDMVVPGEMGGLDLAREIRRLRPGFPVVLTTGYSESLANAGGFRVLAKPYDLDSLVQALEEEFAGDPAAKPGASF